MYQLLKERFLNMSSTAISIYQSIHPAKCKMLEIFDLEIIVDLEMTANY